MRDHGLLQAIARVNRKKRGKPCGYVVDYIGIGKLLKEAMLVSEGGDTGGGGGTDTSREEIPRLEDYHKQVMDIFKNAGISDIADIEPCVDLLADVKIRASFIKKLRKFLISLGIVLPLPEGKKYLRDAKILGSSPRWLPISTLRAAHSIGRSAETPHAHRRIHQCQRC